MNLLCHFKTWVNTKTIWWKQERVTYRSNKIRLVLPLVLPKGKQQSPFLNQFTETVIRELVALLILNGSIEILQIHLISRKLSVLTAARCAGVLISTISWMQWQYFSQKTYLKQYYHIAYSNCIPVDGSNFAIKKPTRQTLITNKVTTLWWTSMLKYVFK